MAIAPQVFVSYSHDSGAHRQQVLALSERLRGDGVETVLDQYVDGTPAQGWSDWVLNCVDEADQVLNVCTPAYYRNFCSDEKPVGDKGADWEGPVISREIYDAFSATTRFVPVLLDPGDEAQISEPLLGLAYRYCLTSESAYQVLRAALLHQEESDSGTGRIIPSRSFREGESSLDDMYSDDRDADLPVDLGSLTEVAEGERIEAATGPKPAASRGWHSSAIGRAVGDLLGGLMEGGHHRQNLAGHLALCS